LPSKGVLILYSNSAQLDYYKLSKLCSRLAEQYLNVPCTIQYIEPEQNNFRTFRYPENTLEKTEWNNIGRFSALDLSPYDETILLDSDYIVQSNTLANYFGCDHDFLCHNKSWDVTGNDVFRHDQYMTQNKFEMRWATVIYFKKTEKAKQIFKTWCSVYENYNYYSKLFGFRRTPFRNDFAMSIAHQICSGYKNSYTFNHDLPALSSSDSVLDYNKGKWLLKYAYKNSYNIMRYTGDLHVMNKHSLLDIADKL